jgi:hypothetical protein
MKKFVSLLIALVFVVGLAGFSPKSVSAQKFTYTSGIQVMNLSSEEATISFEYYDSSTGTMNGVPVNDTISGGESKNYYPHPTAGFSGSLVISSNQPMAAVSNIQTPDGTARASYVAASAGNDTVYLPTLMTKNSNNDTWISIQNAGDADATVSVDYSDCATGEPTGIVIKAGASATINNATETCHATKIYSAVVSSNQPIVAVVLQEKPGVMYAYTGLTSTGATNPVMPIATFNNSNNQTGIQIQNTSGASTDVTITYTPSAVGGAGATCTETQTVPAGSSVTFGWPAFVSPAPAGYAGVSTCNRGGRFLGSAQVTGNTTSATLNSVVNQAKYGTSRADAYTAFSDSAGSPKVVFPLIFDRRGSSAQLITAFNLFNVGDHAIDVKCTFLDNSYVFTYHLGVNEGVTDNQYQKLGYNYLGSGSCTAYTNTSYSTPDSSARMVAVVNEVTSYVTNLYDTLMIYEAINTTP